LSMYTKLRDLVWFPLARIVSGHVLYPFSYPTTNLYYWASKPRPPPQNEGAEDKENLKSSRKARAHTLGDKSDRLCRRPRAVTTLARPITGHYRTSAYIGIGFTAPV
jgi:hypothetical protein